MDFVLNIATFDFCFGLLIVKGKMSRKTSNLFFFLTLFKFSGLILYTV
jgi:hypothetical protein